MFRTLSGVLAKRFGVGVPGKGICRGRVRYFHFSFYLCQLGNVTEKFSNVPSVQHTPVVTGKGLIELNATTCSGCGTPFQSSYPNSPGFLTKEKYQEHLKRSDLRKRMKESLKILTTASIDIKSDLANTVLKEAGIPEDVIVNLQMKQNKATVGIEDEVTDMHQVKVEQRSIQDENAVNICQRCYRLKQYGQLETALRPGWSTDEVLSTEKFKQVISVAKDAPCVVLCLIDVFDLSGSILTNLKQIAGKNPIFIGANKVDLLPKNVPPDRLHNWIYNELREQCKLVSFKEKQEEIELFKKQNISQKGWYEANVVKGLTHEGVLKKEHIHLISCSTGKGVKELIQEAVVTAKEFGNLIYVLGAANVGKSSLINSLLN